MRGMRHPGRVSAAIVPGEAGFTLIELLVSLALMGMAAALLLQGLATAALVSQRARIATDGLDEVVAAQRLLRSEIERLRAVTRINASIPLIDMEGSGGVFTFVGPPLDRGAPDALQRFRLTRTANGELVLYHASTRKISIDRTGQNLVGWTPNTLLGNVRELSISYFGPPRPGEARGWLNRWVDRSTTPELVRIRIGFEAGDKRSWPDLVIRPRATRYGACRVDAYTGKCGEER